MAQTRRRLLRRPKKTSQVAILSIAAALICGFTYGVTLPETSNTKAGTPEYGTIQKAGSRHQQVDRTSQGLSTALSKFAGLDTRRIERIATRIDHAADACSLVGAFNGGSPQNAELSRLFKILSQSRLARALIRQASRKRVIACIDENTKLLGYYRAGLRLIGLRTSLNQGEKVAYLAHELSHVSQHHKYSDNRYFPAPDLILLRRVREATAEAIATWIAWELLQAGISEPWHEKHTDKFYGDVAKAFKRTWYGTPGPNREVAAARSAFDQWFAEPARLNLYDRMTVDHLERISGDALGLVRPKKSLTHRFLAEIAGIEGRNFLTQVPGRWLTESHYAGGISDRNAGTLDRLLNALEANSADPDDRQTSHLTLPVGTQSPSRRSASSYPSAPRLPSLLR